jgi:hypothetical protein
MPAKLGLIAMRHEVRPSKSAAIPKTNTGNAPDPLLRDLGKKFKLNAIQLLPQC